MQGSVDIERFYEDSFADLLRASPEVAAELGITRVGRHDIPQDRFSDISPQGAAHRRDLMAATLRKLEGLPAPTSEADRVNREVYRFFLRWANFGHLRGTDSGEGSTCDAVANHLSGVQTEIVTCLSRWQTLASTEDRENFVARLAVAPAQVEDLIESLKLRAAADNVMPLSVVRRVTAELDTLLSLPVEQHPIYSRYVESGTGTGPAKVRELLEKGFLPRIQDLRDHLVNGYPEEERIGLCRLDGGDAYYRFLLKAHTTTDLSPQEIHDIGLEELKRLKAATREKLDENGFAGKSLREQYEAFDADDRFRNESNAESREAALRDIETVIHETRTALRPLFGIWPSADVELKAIPQAQESNRHSTYAPPAADGSRPGLFEINLKQLLALNRLDRYTLTYHEAMPGHHVQLSIAQELGAGLPAFRRIVTHDAYIEGWAKYSEMLPWFAGINRDPCWFIARSRNELYSTANLALDTGIHAMGWTREQGIAFFLDNTGSDRAFAENIVDRITAQPAQVCAYKIGMLKVLAARDRMQQAAGAAFDIRRFHDAVLGSGSLPLVLLDQAVDAAIGGRGR